MAGDIVSNAKGLLANRSVMLGISVAGIVGSLLVYGVLQERLMTQPFFTKEGSEEKFKYSVFIVLHNRLISSLIAVVAIIIRKSSFKPVAPSYAYLGVSASNVVATSCQYEALKYVSFPVQTLAKCSKMIPVMVWGMLIMRKKYNLKDYLIAAAITVGATIFVLYGDLTTKSSKHGEKDTSFMGIILMLGYLGFDGFTSTFQDKLFKGYQMETYNQMLYVNLFSSIVSLVTLLSAQQLFPAIDFVIRHPDCWNFILLLSFAATIGQLFILYTIKEYGALIFATIMTTRQFLSILLSCILFAHPLTVGQWGGTGLIFGSLYYKSFTSKDKKHGQVTTKLSTDKMPLSVNEKLQMHDGLLAGEHKSSSNGDMKV